MAKKFHEMADYERSIAMKTYRARHGLNQAGLAKKVGCSLTTIVYLENYKNLKYAKHRTRNDIIWKIEDLIEEDKAYNDR